MTQALRMKSRGGSELTCRGLTESRKETTHVPLLLVLRLLGDHPTTASAAVQLHVQGLPLQLQPPRHHILVRRRHLRLSKPTPVTEREEEERERASRTFVSDSSMDDIIRTKLHGRPRTLWKVGWAGNLSEKQPSFCARPNCFRFVQVVATHECKAHATLLASLGLVEIGMLQSQEILALLCQHLKSIMKIIKKKS